MRQLALCTLFSLFTLIGFAQRAETVKQLVNEGIALHDKGDYENALKKYDEALKIDSSDFDANYEKCLTLMYTKNPQACAAQCKMVVARFADNERVGEVYSIWGSALDDAGQADEALKVYEEGIKKQPHYYLLHFNQGLTYMRIKKYNEALESYTASLKNNALHPSSNYYTGGLLQEKNRIPALLAFAVFLATEPQSERSKKAYDAIQEIVYRGIKKDGNNTTISISSDLLDKKKKGAENDFSDIEFVFSLLGGMDNTKSIDSIAKSPAEKFDLKLQLLINSLGNSKGKGFYWNHYVPFFIELKEKNYTNTLCQLIYYATDKDAQAWANDNPEKVNEFYTWLKAYQWKE